MRSGWMMIVAALAVPGPAAASVIERACLRGDREAAEPVLCACVQAAADLTLDGADQRRGARFFSDPEAAHEAMESDSARDAAFWARWTNFVATAEAFCAPKPPIEGEIGG